MKRSLMQIYVKGSVEAVDLYKKAFDAEVLDLYPNGNGGYAHSELSVQGQVIAVTELTGDTIVGNTMQFCFQFGPGGEVNVRKAYDVLKDGARIDVPIGPCDYSECMVSLVDRFGVRWCLFV